MTARVYPPYKKTPPLGLLVVVAGPFGYIFVDTVPSPGVIVFVKAERLRESRERSGREHNIIFTRYVAAPP